MTEEKKKKAAFEIMIEPETTTIEELREQIEDNILSDYREVTEQIMQNIALQVVSEEKKYAIFYLYKKGDVALDYKALSTLEFLKDHVAFHSIFKPSQDIVQALQIQKLPALMGVMPPQDDAPAEQLQFFSMRTAIKYDDMLQQLLELTGKDKEFKAKKEAEEQSKVPREFVEITSQKDFDKYCVDKKKGCAIGLLNAMEVLDYEKANHAEHL